MFERGLYPSRPGSLDPEYLRHFTKARANFEAFSPSYRREYVEWITEAKAEETRRKRLGTAVEWMAQGKPRNWKYMR